MEEQLVNFETAKLAKEAGFDWPVQNRYGKQGGLNQDLQRRYGQPINFNDEYFQYEYRQYTSAPTQRHLSMWLREKHSIYIETLTYKDAIEEDDKIEYQILWEGTCLLKLLEDYTVYHYCEDHAYYHTEEEALEVQLQFALKHLIEKARQ